MRKHSLVRLIKHVESYEVRVSTFIYYDEDKGRRSISGHANQEEAEEHGKELARREQARLDAAK